MPIALLIIFALFQPHLSHIPVPFIGTVHGFALAASPLVATIANPALREGDIAVLAVPAQAGVTASSTVTFDGAPVALFPYRGGYRAVAGIAIGAKTGTHTFKLTASDGRTLVKAVSVNRGKFARVVLGAPTNQNLTPKKLVQGLDAQKKEIAAALVKPEKVYIASPFGLPLMKNRVASAFGEVYVTESGEVRHLGIDLGAAKGTAVGAINAGIVQKAYADPVYGNTVIVAHGADIFSLYMHLDTIKVREGSEVKKGALVGTVGETGYATAPHLHLSVKIGGVSVDPVRFVGQFR